MITVASLNLQKRFFAPAARTCLGRWLTEKKVDIFLAQEPWPRGKSAASALPGFAVIGGNDRVFAWIRTSFVQPEQETAEFFQRISVAYLTLCNVYLDAYRPSRRAEQLRIIRGRLGGEQLRPLVVVGDFNIGPSAADGVYGGQPSTFNSTVDRQPLQKLLSVGGLVDLGGRNQPEWTVERRMNGRPLAFRCDLALAPAYMNQDIIFGYDHSVRQGEERFTDHSALILRLPVTLSAHEVDSARLLPIAVAEPTVHAHKTAMNRREPSAVAKEVAERLVPACGASAILDYGCGYGADVAFYRAKGLSAAGYDPHSGFGWTDKPDGLFDLVTLIFILNVLPNPAERLACLAVAASYLKPGGRLVVVARSPEEIRREASTKCWSRHHDGFWSHPGRGTFQKGMGRKEIIAYGRHLGLDVSPDDNLIHAPAGARAVVFERPREI